MNIYYIKLISVKCLVSKNSVKNFYVLSFVEKYFRQNNRTKLTNQMKKKKSRIREALHHLTDADSITIAFFLTNFFKVFFLLLPALWRRQRWYYPYWSTDSLSPVCVFFLSTIHWSNNSLISQEILRFDVQRTELKT